MNWSIMFIINSILFGIGLAMDAFSVSMANAMNDPKMSRGRMTMIAGTFAFFQIAMPLIGWICIHTIAETFTSFQKFIPWIALILLLYIGGKMIVESFSAEEEEDVDGDLSFVTLMIQGVATSIDALSVGFTISDYAFVAALIESLIIGVVTFIICIGGLKIGKVFGNKLSNKAGKLGGCILILIGIEIFVKGVFL